LPEPNRPTWRIADGLGAKTLRALAAEGVTVRLECEACSHKAEWVASDFERLFGRSSSETLDRIGPRLRCRSCKSNWVRIYRLGGAGTT
jgi:hypothetical protein